MTNATTLVPRPTQEVSAEMADLHAEARRLVRASRAPATIRGYQSAMRAFTAWCETHGHRPIPASAETLTAYVAHLARRCRPGTIGKIISGITYAHRVAGHRIERDTASAGGASVTDALAGVRRELGTRPKQVGAIVSADLRRIIAALGSEARNIPALHPMQVARDRALLLIGFAGAFRRSELVGLDVGERAAGGTGSIEIGADGARIILHRSKSDQEGAGIVKGIERGGNPDPVAALEHWLALAGIEAGAVFRSIDRAGTVQRTPRTEIRKGTPYVIEPRLSDKAVALIVKRAIVRAEVLTTLPDGGTVGQVREATAAAEAKAAAFAGHSLRRGFATSAAQANISGERMSKHIGWSSQAMAMRYIEDAALFRENIVNKVLG